MDIDEISQYFKIDHESIETTGIGNGVVIKFKTFYLKIYDDLKGRQYYIEGYLYSHSLPVKTWNILYGKLKHFAKLFEYDNFLQEHIHT